MKYCITLSNKSPEEMTTHANIKVNKWMFFSVEMTPQRVLYKVNPGARWAPETHCQPSKGRAHIASKL